MLYYVVMLFFVGLDSVRLGWCLFVFDCVLLLSNMFFIDYVVDYVLD